MFLFVNRRGWGSISQMRRQREVLGVFCHGSPGTSRCLCFSDGLKGGANLCDASGAFLTGRDKKNRELTRAENFLSLSWMKSPVQAISLTRVTAQPSAAMGPVGKLSWMTQAFSQGQGHMDSQPSALSLFPHPTLLFSGGTGLNSCT